MRRKMNIEKISIRFAFALILTSIILGFIGKYLNIEMFIFFRTFRIVSFDLGVIFIGVNTIFSFYHLKMYKRIVLEMFCIFIILVITTLTDFRVIGIKYGLIAVLPFLVLISSRNDFKKKYGTKS